jgi:hypothetical protein
VTRRGFLRGGLLAGSALAVAALPMPAFAQAAPIVVEIVNGIARIPASVASQMTPWQANLANRSVQRVLQVGAQQGLTRSAANGLLTQSIRPILAARGPGGLVRGLVTTGLLVGFAWALQDAIVNTAAGNVTATRSVNTGAMMGYPYESSILNVGTGIYRNHATTPTALTAYQRTTVLAWTGGTVPAPSGWTWVHQRNVTGGVEVWFSKAVAVGATSVVFPPLPMTQVQDAVAPAQVVQEQSLVALEPELARAALLDPQALPNPVTRPYPVPTSPAEPLPYPWPSQPVSPGNYPAPSWGDLTSPVPTPAPAIDPATVPWQFPDVAPFPETNPNPNPSPSPTTPPYPTGDPVEPETVADLPGFEPFVSPFRTLFDPFKGVYAGANSACPSFNMQSVSFGPLGTMPGQTFTYHCQLVEPFKPIIIAASTAAGGWAAISHIVDA